MVMSIQKGFGLGLGFEFGRMASRAVALIIICVVVFWVVTIPFRYLNPSDESVRSSTDHVVQKDVAEDASETEPFISDEEWQKWEKFKKDFSTNWWILVVPIVLLVLLTIANHKKEEQPDDGQSAEGMTLGEILYCGAWGCYFFFVSVFIGMDDWEFNKARPEYWFMFGGGLLIMGLSFNFLIDYVIDLVFPSSEDSEEPDEPD